MSHQAGTVSWRSRTTFFLALSGVAVGLGNFWRLPWLMGEYGGGAFFLLYLVCLFLIAVPLLAAEVYAGVHGAADPRKALSGVAQSGGLSPRWGRLAYLLCFTGLLVLGICVLMGGITLVLMQDMWGGEFAAASAVNMQSYLESLVSSPFHLLTGLSAFLLIALLVAAGGPGAGFGLFFWFAIPTLLVALAVLVRFALDYGDLAAAGDFLFTTDWSRLSSAAFFAALGQAVLTLGAGVGAGIALGSYAPKRTPVLRSVLGVALLDTLVALGAGLAIYPVLFANNVQAQGGAGLLLVALPLSYGGMAEGEIFGSLFFFAVSLALLTTAVVVIEPIIANLRERFGLRRLHAVGLVGILVWLLAMSFAYSLVPPGNGSGVTTLELVGLVEANVLRPAGATLVALLVSWRIGGSIMRVPLLRASGAVRRILRWLLRVPLPMGIVLLAVLAAGPAGR